MREAMARAEVGDDVYGEDQTTLAFQEEVAALLGKEAALFVPSGTMSNQLAIKCHTRPGDEVIVGETGHTMWFESGAAAVLSGVMCAVAGSGGLFDADQMEAAIKPPQYWFARSALVCVENTHNAAGGRIFPQKNVIAISERARARGLAMHLDGARLWNASVATGLSLQELAAPFDTVSVCFSKGLGAPVGSALVGSKLIIKDAHRLRKMWGGGMRQIGILTAGAAHALHHHRDRLKDDHANAKLLGEKLRGLPGVKISDIETNIVIVDLPFAAEIAVNAAKAKGLAISAFGPSRLRAVTHLDVSRADVERAADILRDVVSQNPS